MQGYNTSGAANYSSAYSYDRNGNLDALKRETLNANKQVVKMDDLTYTYNQTKTNPLTGEITKNNQLNHVTDAIKNAGFNDLASQLPNNYKYDEIGQLTADNTEGITNINWRVDGKVASIIKKDNTKINFKYDGLGNRIAKTVLPENTTTVYTRDAQGNVLAVYNTNQANPENITTSKEVNLKEHHIYGSSRLGIEQKHIAIPEDGNTLTIPENLVLTADNITNQKRIQAANTIKVAGANANYTIAETGNVTMRAGNQILLKPGFKAAAGSTFLAEIKKVNKTLPENTFARLVGDKRYELSNHLGNVLAVVSDRKLVPDPLNFTNFTPDVLTFNDYYPFGMLLPNRHGSSDSYRYGFSGQESDNAVKGQGNSYDFGARILDPRVGRWLSLDPQAFNFPYESNYNYVSNNPLIYKDPNGEAKIYTIIFTDATTGETTSRSVVIDEDFIKSKVSKLNNLLIPSEYTWHDVNVIQHVTFNGDGSISIGEPTEVLLDPLKTTTSQNFNNESWAKSKIKIASVLGVLDTPKKNQTWDGGGIDFYSKSGEGSGVKAKDRSKLDYVNGDELMAIMKLGKGFSKGQRGATVTPYPDIIPGKKSELLNAVLKVKKVLSKFKKNKKELEKITPPIFELVHYPNECERCGRYYSKISKKFIDKNDLSKDQIDNARQGTTEDHKGYE